MARRKWIAHKFFFSSMKLVVIVGIGVIIIIIIGWLLTLKLVYFFLRGLHVNGETIENNQISKLS